MPAQSAPERILEKLPLFASLTEEHKTVLAAKMKRRAFEPGELVIERGVVAETLAIVQSGALALYQVRDGREHELVRLGPAIISAKAACCWESRSAAPSGR